MGILIHKMEYGYKYATFVLKFILNLTNNLLNLVDLLNFKRF